MNWDDIVAAEKNGDLPLANESHQTITEPTVPVAGTPSWGKGGAKHLHLIQSKPFETVVFLYDLHIPHHDLDLFEAALKAITALQPDTIVIGGDAADHPIISRWHKETRAKMQEHEVYTAVKTDCDILKDCINRIRKAAPRARIVYLSGNHDERAEEWLGDPAVLCEWYGLSLDEYHSRAGVFLRPNFLAMHGNYATANTAKKHYTEYQCSGISGHKHEKAMHCEIFPATNRRCEWFSAPAMCSLEADYLPGGAGLARWFRGITVGMFSTTDEFDFSIDTGDYWNGVLTLRGVRY